MRYIWLSLGCISVAFGVAGIVLPLLPTTPFLLLAAFCFARSSPQLHNWLINHPRLGPAITAWNDRGAIPIRAKLLAMLMMAATFLASLTLFRIPGWALALQGAILAAVAAFILSRPSA